MRINKSIQVRIDTSPDRELVITSLIGSNKYAGWEILEEVKPDKYSTGRVKYIENMHKCPS